MKVLVLSHLFPHPDSPGSGSFVLEQVKALRDHEHVEVRVVSGRPRWRRGAGPLGLNASLLWRACCDGAASADVEQVPTRYVPYHNLPAYWAWGWQYRRALRREIAELRETFPFELVHAHTAYLDGSMGAEVSTWYRVPLLITEHTGPFNVLTRNTIVRRNTVNALNCAEYVIAVSAAQRDAVRPYLSPSRRERLMVMPNGVDGGLFSPPERWQPDPKAPRLLFIGYFVPLKNLPVLLQAFRVVIGELPAARLTLAGGAPKPAGELELCRSIRELGLTGHVRVLGFLPRPQVAALLRDECDVLVLPSQAETFGCVLVEALASGKPVVATRCGGPEDIVTHPGLGALCPPGDPEALARTLLETIRRLPEFKPREIREEALRRFSYQRLARELHGLYRGALSACSTAQANLATGHV